MSLTIEHIPEMLEQIHKGMMAFMYWKTFYPTMYKKLTDSNNIYGLKVLTENYYKVNQALLVYLNFMDEHKEILSHSRDALMFGVIYETTKKMDTEDLELQKAMERYNKWYSNSYKI
jgi:hypothetical protein